MITLDEFNERMIVAGDAEQEARHEIARQIRDSAWRDIGCRKALSHTDGMFNQFSALVEVCIRGIVSRGYQLRDCALHHGPAPDHSVVVVYANASTAPHWVLDMKTGLLNPGPPGLSKEIEYGIRWIGPRWPTRLIPESDSDAWLERIYSESKSKWSGILRSVQVTDKPQRAHPLADAWGEGRIFLHEETFK